MMDQDQPAPNPASLFQAAVQSFQAQDWSRAEVLCRQALNINPGYVDALNLLALVCNVTGRKEESIARLREAVQLQPTHASLWINLGGAYRNAGQLAQAVECQHRAIALNASIPEAHYNLSLAYQGLGQLDDAIAAARRATELRPGYAQAQLHLADVLCDAGRLHEAVAAYQAVLQLYPDWPEPHFRIAHAWYQLRQPARSVEHLREVLRFEPGRSDAEYGLANSLAALGHIEEAKSALARADAASGRRHDSLGVLACESMAETVPPDNPYIEQYKLRLAAAVRAFAADPRPIDLSTIHVRAAMPSPMLAYYGGDVREIMEQYAAAIGPQIPRVPLRRRQGKSKLGIMVTNGHEGVFARCWGGIAERLSRESFDVRLVCSPSGANLLMTKLNVPPEEYLRLPAEIDAAARLLHEQEFDWLHFWEIGNNWPNYYLPYCRTAPGQSGCWGWPVTSGNPQVDAYLSCEQIEPPEGPSHYSEQLVLLKRLPTYFVRPPLRRGTPRSHFGLEDSQRVYLCAQNVRKYHPDFDPVLAELLRRDPQGVLVIIGDAQASITELLLARFRRTMPDVMSRVRALSWMEPDEYLALVALADLTLDTLHYGAGANTVYDTVAVGTPLITLPGEFHRARWAGAVNRRLLSSHHAPRDEPKSSRHTPCAVADGTRNVPATIAQSGSDLAQWLIASTPEDYVAKAVQVASNADLREALRRQILEAGAELFEDTAVVREHDEYFSQAIAGARAAD
ncbi:MAG: tetratricopeptide repeat protein [Planctomycetes bacterium]|nr:tetratricopeptide repeat protein [Planctomycetota bacterium]